MTASQDNQYYKGYIAGYRDGVTDAANGKTGKMIERDITNLPIKAMGLSARAYNCLHGAGCTHIVDVVALSEHTIATMRNLGTKTASEIAHWLDGQGICFSAWSEYL